MKDIKKNVVTFVKERVSILEDLSDVYLENIKEMIEQKAVISDIREKIIEKCNRMKSCEDRISELTELKNKINSQ